ncbi:hypothetical protein A3F08_01030 [Candidatus Berkelbacteria bacterium RIFCSPHIGHO2_12_FULL_36_9]|uniref:FtsK domain-containing protein n=1 Tax=Candidatus Berkelbacteria bacterium RIFCSPHIGHO2_12_FULL_36_9 TaxID=1797469 RepID=A0A1F5EF01_9BACT|nr:MAG: hypothetical protein A3F08_01030 [Candidatus Berkelbacteria bacterium RIFCSPHIGHO2_12_FULL_36_9]
MSRKRKYRKHQSIWEKYDWSVNPETSREIITLILTIIGLFLILSISSVAGSLGNFFKQLLVLSFGKIGYLIPFVLLSIAIILWMPKKFEIKPSSVVGIVLTFIFIPALINPLGGAIGAGIHSIFERLFGPIASFIIILGLVFVAIILALNTSIRSLIGKFMPSSPDNVQVHGQEQRVSVFTTLKNKMVGQPQTGQPRPSPVNAPVSALPNLKSGWKMPTLDLLETSSTKATSGNIAKNVEVIQKTLKDFNIDVSMGDVNIGPTVTQYCLKPKEGIKLNQIVARTNDLALALAAHPIRIEAPIPGKAAVGVEIPNKVPAIVTLREILEADNYKTKKSNLSLAVGRDVAGSPIITDLRKMPHLLIAGATGSGKSICINGIIISLIYQNSPNDLRILLVDPKRVEFTPYNGIPHLLAPVIIEPDKTINALKWAVSEMERRFKVFQEHRQRDIESYNANPPEGQKMAYIVIVIDELADLMAQSANEVEAAIVRLAQMARATGIHLVVATQRPSVDVITGLIKANITTRVAFAVASQIDSRTIIDQSGAEKLLGYGDMLYLSSEFGKPRRIQGVLVTDKEVKKVTDFLKSGGDASYDESITNYRAVKPGMAGSDGEIDDEMYDEAKRVVINAGKASASLLQRRLRVGYARAARLLDLMEEQGVIGPSDGAKPRDVLVGFNDGYNIQTPQNRQFNQVSNQNPYSSNQFNRPNSQSQDSTPNQEENL